MDFTFDVCSAVQKALFRVAFHGGFGNVWGALMSIPEVRTNHFKLTF